MLWLTLSCSFTADEKPFNEIVELNFLICFTAGGVMFSEMHRLILSCIFSSRR